MMASMRHSQNQAGRFNSALLPRNHRLPSLYRILRPADDEAPAQGELARDPKMAAAEAALFAADEPLNARRLAAVAGVADANEARRIIRKLQSLYEKDGSAFQIEEL